MCIHHFDNRCSGNPLTLGSKMYIANLSLSPSLSSLPLSPLFLSSLSPLPLSSSSLPSLSPLPLPPPSLLFLSPLPLPPPSLLFLSPLFPLKCVKVIRGLRLSRGGLVENQQQFEFCHRVLEEVMWGRVEGEEGVEEENSGGRKKGRKWKLFRRRKKNGKTLEVGDL